MWYYRLHKKKVNKWSVTVFNSGKGLRNSSSNLWFCFLIYKWFTNKWNKNENEWNNCILEPSSALSFKVYFNNQNGMHTFKVRLKVCWNKMWNKKQTYFQGHCVICESYIGKKRIQKIAYGFYQSTWIWVLFITLNEQEFTMCLNY